MSEQMIHEEEIFTPLLAIEEAARCLLCHEPPCSEACPAGTNPGKFIRSLRFRNLKGAAETIREENPLGAICAKVCPTEKYCEGACSRCGIDRPIQIAKLQEYLTNYEKTIGMKVNKSVEQTKAKVAIIGSGPSGLVAGWALAMRGYQPTIFEKREKVGGWLTYGIPTFRLRDELITYEVEMIKQIGVQFVTACEFGKDETIKSLKNKGYEAILIATGYSKPREADLFKGSKRVQAAVSFLAQVKSGEYTEEDLAENVLIIGGGDVAMDVAMTAKSIGSQSIKVVAIESLKKFPASKKELSLARAHHISIIDGFKPIKYDGRTVTFESVVDNSEMRVSPDKIILAIGQEDGCVRGMHELEKDKKGHVKVKGYQTNIPYVFVAGDLVAEDKTVVYAIKTGKEAAQAIHCYLGGSEPC